MESWKTVRLGDVCDIQMGQSPQGESCNSVGEGIPLLNGPTEFGSYYPSAVQWTIDAKKICQIDDLLFCVRGSTTGRMNWANDKYAIGRGLASIRHKQGAEYKYFIKALIEYNLPSILASATGSTFPNVSRDLLNSLAINIPPLDEQRRIAGILGALDDKIELNNRINSNLEAQAAAIFRSWFVDFEFPNAAGKPYKSTGGEFIDSPLGKIPKGWIVGKLGDLIDVKYGKDHQKLNKGIIPVYGSGGIMRYADTFIYDKESVLIPRKGTLNNVFYIDTPFWTVDTMFYSILKIQNVAKYVYFFLKSKDLASMNTGSAVPSMTTEILNQMQTVIADKRVFLAFDIISSSIFSKIKNNSLENQTLATLRDNLLPKLMNNEI